MAAFTAENQTDRRAFLDKVSRLRADTSVSNRVIDVDGVIAGTIGSFRIDDQLEVTYWVDRASVEDRHRDRCAANSSCRDCRTTSLRPGGLGQRRLAASAGEGRFSDASASTAASQPVAVRRSRRRSCASTEAGTEPSSSFEPAPERSQAGAVDSLDAPLAAPDHPRCGAVRDGARLERDERLDLADRGRPRYDRHGRADRDHRVHAGDGGVHARGGEARRHLGSRPCLRVSASRSTGSAR